MPDYGQDSGFVPTASAVMSSSGTPGTRSVVRIWSGSGRELPTWSGPGGGGLV